MTRCRVSRDREPRRDPADNLRMVAAIALFGLALVCTFAFGAALAQQGAFQRLAATYASLQGGMR
jgi:hypothetical protein